MTDTVPEQPVEMKVCPSCAEPVRAAAKMCRYCGYHFDEVPAAAGANVASSARTGGILTTIAGALLVAGSLLPWALLHVFARTVRRSGLHWQAGVFALALGILVLLVGIASLLRVRLPRLTGLAVIAAGLIAGILGVWEFARVSTRLSTFRALAGRFGAPRFLGHFAGGHVGIGLWAVIAGSVVAIVAGFLLQTLTPEEAPQVHAPEGDQPAAVSA